MFKTFVFRKASRKKYMVLATTLFFVLLQAGLALAAGEDSTAIMADPTTVPLKSLGGGVAIFVNFLRYIGATILLGIGYWHTFSVSANAKNANKRALAMEGLLWTGVAIFVFFGGSYLMGVLKGVSDTISGG